MFEERSEVGSAAVSNTARWAAVVVLLLVVAIGGMFAYSVHQRTVARQREMEKQQIEQQLSQTRQEIEAVTAKLSALSVQQQQQAQAEFQQLQAQRAAAIRGSRVRTRAEEKRYKELRSKLDAQNQAIDQTRTDLTSAKTEL